MKKLLIILAAAIIAGSSMSASAADEPYYYEFYTSCGITYSYSSYVELSAERVLELYDYYESLCDTINTGVHLDVETIL